MRIVHVISSPSGIGGAERVLLELVDGGRDRGWEQRVLHPFAEGEDNELGVLCPAGTYTAFPCARVRDLPRTRAGVGREVRRLRPEIVHVHLFHALVLVASLPRVTESKLLLTHHHGSRYVEESQPLRALVDRVCDRRFDAVVAVSEATRRFLAERYRLDQRKLVTIPNGWCGTPLPRTRPPGHRVVCVGNFRAQKGHDVLLAAFAQVSRRIPDAELVLVGEGPLRASLERTVERLGISERVAFSGAVPDVWPILAESDVFALASRYEPLGIAVLEAMAAGVPVVASRVGGLPEIVEDGVNGHLVEPGNAGALAGRLVEVLSSPRTIAKMIDASRHTAARHRAERMIEQYMDLYEQLAGNPRWRASRSAAR